MSILKKAAHILVALGPEGIALAKQLRKATETFVDEFGDEQALYPQLDSVASDLALTVEHMPSQSPDVQNAWHLINTVNAWRPGGLPPHAHDTLREMESLLKKLEGPVTAATDSVSAEPNPYAAQEARLFQRAVPMAERAVGKTFKVRTSKTSTVQGTIISAKPWKVSYRGRSMYMLFEVVLEAGDAKVRHTVHVDTLPR